MIHWFYCFPCLSTLFQCLYLGNNQLISFSVLCSYKNLFCFMIKFVSRFRLLSTFLVKLQGIVFVSVIITNLLSLMYTPIIIMIWLNCCKFFWRIYYTDIKNIVFVWFHFLVCMTCFLVLFVCWQYWNPVFCEFIIHISAGVDSVYIH